MKKLSILVSAWATLLGFTGTLLMPVMVSAATPKNSAKLGQALEIAPPVINVSANPGQTIKTTIYLRDVAKGALIVTGQANDFVAAGEDGTPKLLLKSDETSPYSLKDWVGPLPSLNLVPKEIKTMTISINVPKNASPGGHYGVIRFTATPADLKSTGVSLSASLGALILMRVNGKVKENLSVKSFTVSHGSTTGTLLESAPLTFTERLHNGGNVHVAPTGQVTVKNMFGKTVGAVNVNSPPRNILPSSIRKFNESFDKSVIGNKKLFGKYTADLKLKYGSNKTLTDSITFWVIPYRLIIAVAIALVALFFILRSTLRRYNRRIIEKAQSGGGAAAQAEKDDAKTEEVDGEEPSEGEETDQDDQETPDQDDDEDDSSSAAEAGTDEAAVGSAEEESAEETEDTGEESPSEASDTSESDSEEEPAPEEEPEEPKQPKKSKSKKKRSGKRK